MLYCSYLYYYSYVYHYDVYHYDDVFYVLNHSSLSFFFLNLLMMNETSYVYSSYDLYF
jgi:hypothetical protein